MSSRLIAAITTALLFVASPGRADLTKDANVDSPADVERLSLTDLDFPEFGISAERYFRTVDMIGTPSASPEINVSLNAYNLPEPYVSSGISRLLILVVSAFIAFVTVSVIITFLRRLWGYKRIAHL